MIRNKVDNVKLLNNFVTGFVLLRNNFQISNAGSYTQPCRMLEALKNVTQQYIPVATTWKQKRSVQGSQSKRTYYNNNNNTND